MPKIDQLKKLAVKLGCCSSEKDVKGDSVVKVINFINDNLPAIGGGGGGVSNEPDAIIDYDIEEYIDGNFKAIWDKLQNNKVPKVIMKHTEGDCVSLMECNRFTFQPADGVELGYDHIWIDILESEMYAITSMTLTDDDGVYCSPYMCVPPEGDEWEE